jgi:predicted AAA+ superfamily ATPase
MDSKEADSLSKKIASFAVFRELNGKRPLFNLKLFLEFSSHDSHWPGPDVPAIYGEFVNSLAEYGFSFSDWLKSALAESDNIYVRAVAKGETVPQAVKKNAEAELDILTSLTTLTPASLYSGPYVPVFDNEYTNLSDYYGMRLKNISRLGYGIFASHTMFRLDGDEIVPSESPDTVTMDSFVKYESQRDILIRNTENLLSGKAASNVLLYGDAGTGKSSSVKATANLFSKEGLRLIEIRKDQIFSLPFVLGKISGNPLKFIIFIDDLSFSENDDSFSMLKAVLEGSTSAKADNAVIYATSNRRHIVKENFSDRSDDVHRNDTLQELMSLSDRFGITIYFEKPDKETYLHIAEVLAKRKGIEPDPDFRTKAEAFALKKGGRSPRTAEQFADSLR